MDCSAIEITQMNGQIATLESISLRSQNKKLAPPPERRVPSPAPPASGARRGGGGAGRGGAGTYAALASLAMVARTGSEVMVCTGNLGGMAAFPEDLTALCLFFTKKPNFLVPYQKSPLLSAFVREGRWWGDHGEGGGDQATFQRYQVYLRPRAIPGTYSWSDSESQPTSSSRSPSTP